MDPVLSLLKCLAVMCLSLASKDVTQFRQRVQTWSDTAEPFLRKHSILRDFRREVGIFLGEAKMEMNEEDAEVLAKLFKEWLPDITADTSVTQEQLAYLKSCVLFMRKDSQPAWKRIVANARVMKDPAVSAALLKADDGQELTDDRINVSADPKTAAAMSALVKQLVGRLNDPILTLNEIRNLRETRPKEIEKYSALRKVFQTNYKAALLRFVRASGEETVDVKKANSYLDGLGCNYIPKGYVGRIDEQGRLYTIENKLLNGMLIGTVTMNPKYDAKKDNTYVCSLASNRSQRLRTQAFMLGNKRATFDKVRDFAEGVNQHRKSWLRDLKSLDEKTQTIAALVETIYEVQARIGGDSTNKDNEERFGMSTLQLKHLKLDRDGAHFDYPGKKGTRQTHWLKPNTLVGKQVLAIIKDRIKNKRPDDFVFTYRGHRLTAQAVNAYLKSIGVHVTIHKFRHLKGTKMALEILDSSPFKKSEHPSQASVEKWVKEEFKAIGEALHHRSGVGDKEKTVSSTAIQAYVDPAILKGYFTDLGLRVPNWVPKA